MIKRQKQLIRHDPGKSQWGDCYRTCIAMVLGLNASEVPHFADGGEADTCKDRVDSWLEERGLKMFAWYFDAEVTAFPHLLEWAGRAAGDDPYIVSVQSAVADHCIVGLGDEVFCDPATGEKPARPRYFPQQDPNGREYYWIEFIAGALPQNFEAPA